MRISRRKGRAHLPDVPRLIQPRWFIRGGAHTGGSAAFTPEDVADLVLWVDTQSGITLNGTDVSGWEARNDATIDFVQATASVQPLYTAAAINGVQAIDFEDANTKLTSGSVTHNVAAGDFYIAAVVERESLGFAQIFEFEGGGTAFNVFFNASDLLSVSGGGGLNDTFDLVTTLGTATPAVVEVWRDGTTLRGLINGTEATGTLSHSFNYGSSGICTFEFWDGEIGDTVFYSSLPSAAERTSIRNFLSNKFGITTFTPESLPDLICWFDASQSATVTLNGSDVSNWEAVNNASIDAAQATATEQPAYLTAERNGLNAIDFIQDDNTSLDTGSVTHNLGTGDCYFWCVLKWDDNTDENQTLMTFNPSSATVQLFIAGNNLRFIFWVGSRNEFLSLSIPYQDWCIIECWRDGTSLRARINNVLDEDSLTELGDFGTSHPLRIGDFGDDLEVMSGTIGEMGFTSSLPTLADRDKNYAYLKDKWAIDDAFTPYQLPHLILWLEPSTFITLNGADVSSWLAKNDSDADFAQATAADQPLYTGVTLGPNAVQALEFDGVDHFLPSNSVTHDIGTGDFYVAFVCNLASVVASGTDGVFSLDTKLNITIADSEWFIWDVADHDGASFNSLSPIAGRDYIVEFWYDGASQRMRVNGVLDTDGRTNAGSNLGTSGAFHISQSGADDAPYPGKIGDIIVTSSLPSAAQRDACRDFLASKYGISVFTPEDVSSLVFWLDTESGITLSGSDVSGWEARNDAGIDWTMGTAANRPEYTSVAINGVQALDFDGNDELGETGATYSVGTGDFYFAVVLSPDVLDTRFDILFEDTSDFFFRRDSGNAPSLETPAGEDAFDSHVVDASPHVLEFWRTGTSIRCRLDGVLDSDGHTNNGDMGSNGALIIGHTDFNTYDGQFGDFVFCDSLPTAGERDNIRDFLARKFGITLFTPAALSDLVFWMDPQQGVTLNGNNVSSWKAVNNASIDFTQGSAGAQPLYTGAAINGVQALELIPNDEMSSGTVTHNIGTGDFYLCMVVRADSLADNISILAWGGAADNGPYVDLGDWKFGMPGTDPRFNSIVPATGTDYILEFWRDGTSVRCRQNGVIDSDSRTNSGNLGTSGAFLLGETDFGGDNWDGEIGDIVLVSSLPSLSERNLTVNYLADKYGITVTL